MLQSHACCWSRRLVSRGIAPIRARSLRKYATSVLRLWPRPASPPDPASPFRSVIAQIADTLSCAAADSAYEGTIVLDEEARVPVVELDGPRKRRTFLDGSR